MNRTIRILSLLAVMAITAGQVWAEAPTYGKIHHTNGGTDGGSLCFSNTLDLADNCQTDFNSTMNSSGNDLIYTYTVTGKTLADGKVYVRALPSFGYTVTDMTLIVEPSAPSSTAEAPRRGAPAVASTIPVTPVEGHSGVYTFLMPTDGTNVTVTASFSVSTPINVDYLDATGAKKTAQAYVLDGAELYLGESGQEIWYVCNSDIDYRSKVTLHGDAHLILADGKTMTISAGNQHAIDAENGVTIHGQSGASGKLIAESTGSNGIYSKGDIAIMSADVTFTSTGTTGFGVQANPGNITITDSKVTVNSGYHGIVAINVSNNLTKGNITINGSQVTAIGSDLPDNYGIYAAGGDITLGWKNTTDFIKASSYFIEGSGNVKTADGKPFIAYTPAASETESEKPFAYIAGGHTFTADELTAIAGKKLNANADGLAYLDWDDTQKKLVSKNTATDNNADNDIVYVLQGTERDLGTNGEHTWYIAKPGFDLSQYTFIQNFGEVHLILADNAAMTVTNSNSRAINVISPFTIYAQSEDEETMGSLTAIGTGENTSGINVNNNLIINGGKVTATANSKWGIYATLADITINGGKVTASSENSDCIYVKSTTGTANLTITGGQVEAISASGAYGIHADNGDITLSLTNSSDYIKVSSYSASGSVKIPAGKALAYTDEDDKTIILGGEADYIFGSGTNKTLGDIANKTLRVSKNLPVSAVNAQYAALYQEDGDWKVTDTDIKMYVPTGKIIKNGIAYEMELQEVTGGGIPNGVPVILGKEGGLGDIPVVGTSADEANTIETNYNDAESEIEQKHKDEHTEPALTLFATNTTETLAQQIINAASPKDAQGNVIEENKVAPNDYVVLGIVNGKLTTLSANQTAVPSSTQPVVVISKFDLLQMIRGTYAATNSNAPSIVIDLGDVTGVEEVVKEGVKEGVKMDDSWYMLDGRRIANGQQPTAKGIYINKGIKRVVR